MVKFLLVRGALAEKLNSDGKTAKDYTKNKKIVKMLEQYENRNVNFLNSVTTGTAFISFHFIIMP